MQLSIEAAQEETLKLNFSRLRNPNKPLILHAALEGPNAIVGGLGIILRDLGGQLATHKGNTLTITPYYQFLREKLKDTHSLGFFKHFLFNQEVTTEVFSNKKDHQILFSPDETIEDGILAVTKPEELYENTQNYLRLVYFNSAIAKFADLIDADVVQLHAWQTALTAALLKKKYNLERQKINKKDIKIISTIHMLNHEQGEDSGDIFSHVGLPKESEKINLAVTAIQDSDFITTVSKGIITSFNHPEESFGLFKYFQEKRENLSGITNGISYPRFSPFLKENLGEFALTSNFTIEELKDKKSLVKKILYNHKIISSDSKPLMLAILRFSNEKGIEFLEPAAEEWLKMGGQMVIMGLFTQDIESNKKIMQLKNNCNLKDLRVYTELSDQINNLSGEIQVQIGKLVRFATDTIIIPSKVESCGLIGMELLSGGSFVCTSWVQGLKDMILPYGEYHPLLKKNVTSEDFNGVSFEYFQDDFKRTVWDLKKNLSKCYALINGELISSKDIWIRKMNIIHEAKKFDWQHETGALNQYMNLYSLLIGNTIQKSITYNFQNTVNENNLMQILLQKYGSYPERKVEFKYTKYAPLVLSTLHTRKREKETLENTRNLQEKSKTTIDDGKIFFQGEVLDTKLRQSMDKSFYATWILSKKGTLFLGSPCHAFFLKSKPGKENYGYAKPTACGGDLFIADGKIKIIDNRSGHYQHNMDQFLLSLHHLYKKNVLAADCKITLEGMEAKSIPLSQVRELNVEDILCKYKTLLEDIEK